MCARLILTKILVVLLPTVNDVELRKDGLQTSSARRGRVSSPAERMEEIFPAFIISKIEKIESGTRRFDTKIKPVCLCAHLSVFLFFCPLLMFW